MQVLNLLYTTRGVLPGPWMGFGKAFSMDLFTSRVQNIQEPPSVYFIPFSSPRPLLQ